MSENVWYNDEWYPGSNEGANAGQDRPQPRRLTLPALEREIELQVRIAAGDPDSCAVANYALGKVTALYWLLGYDWTGAASEAEARLKGAGVKI